MGPASASAGMTDDPRRRPAGRNYDADLATVKTDIGWIRKTLEEANLVNRVGSLERAQAKTQGVIAAITGSVLLIGALVGAAKAAGLIH